MALKKFFIVVTNGEQTRLEWTQQDEFIAANLKQHKFGEIARNLGEAPFKAVFTFKTDGNIQGIRGDTYTGKPMDMLRNLYKLSIKYWKEDKIHEVKIYDNRGVLVNNQSLILHWHQVRGTLINLLPIYSGEYDLKQSKIKTHG